MAKSTIGATVKGGQTAASGYLPRRYFIEPIHSLFRPKISREWSGLARTLAFAVGQGPHRERPRRRANNTVNVSVPGEICLPSRRGAQVLQVQIGMRAEQAPFPGSIREQRRSSRPGGDTEKAKALRQTAGTDRTASGSARLGSARKIMVRAMDM
jgi:hypothetical protein